ncbi:PEP-CTERM sorting domain-containing protein [bacterium]|nr:MAG: PEP-CTERM sorting domain-containing protein [bacterium]
MSLRTLLPLLTLATAATASAGTFNFSGALTNADSVFNRPLESGSTLSSVGTAVRYDTQLFTVSQSGAYTLFIQSDAPDTFLLLYASFDPLAPLSNFIGGNDDKSGSLTQSELTANLTAGTTYAFVTTSFSNADRFGYNNSITGLGTVNAVPEPASMAALALGGLAFLRRRKQA